MLIGHTARASASSVSAIQSTCMAYTSITKPLFRLLAGDSGAVLTGDSAGDEWAGQAKDSI